MKKKEIPGSLMAFTFFYAVAIYLLMIGFYFWDKHIDYKEDK